MLGEVDCDERSTDGLFVQVRKQVETRVLNSLPSLSGAGAVWHAGTDPRQEYHLEYYLSLHFQFEFVSVMIFHYRS